MGTTRFISPSSGTWVRPLWWLILCVNLIAPLGTQILGQTLVWVCLWGCFWIRFTFEWVDYVKQIAFPKWTGWWNRFHPIYWKSAERKGRIRSLFLAVFKIRCWTGTYIISLLCSQNSGLRWKLYHKLSWPPACWWQIMGLLSLHNCVSQFVIINDR